MRLDETQFTAWFTGSALVPAQFRVTFHATRTPCTKRPDLDDLELLSLFAVECCYSITEDALAVREPDLRRADPQSLWEG